MHFLKILHKLYTSYFNISPIVDLKYDKDPDNSSITIYDALVSKEPKMIARFGSVEMNCLLNYIGVTKKQKPYLSYIKGTYPPWWWDNSILNSMYLHAGFFPIRIDKIIDFCENMISDINQVDVLGSWLQGENFFKEELHSCLKVDLELLNPYFSSNPWTKALEGKKVLVVHPFAKTIQSQYKNRKLLFENDLLPAFDLKTIEAVQSIAGEKTRFNDWFEALNYMKEEIDKTEYDICLIGCGAYGFPLAAHVKRTGKKGFHMGGSLQLLFGIRGNRWENQNYNDRYDFTKLMNEYWVKPSNIETPVNASKIEGSCYW